MRCLVQRTYPGLKNECGVIPKRVIFSVMAFVGVAIALMLRVAFSVAIIEMVLPISKKNNTKQSCPVETPGIEEIQHQNVSSKDHVHYDWDQETQGLLFGAFFIGYIVTHIPGGYFSDIFGGKYTFGMGMLFTCIFTYVTPLAASDNYGSLVVVRIMTGFGEGGIFPAVTSLLAKWIPSKERGFFGGFVFGGSLIGSAAGTFFAGVIMDRYPRRWSYVFFAFATLGVVWCLLWQFLCFSIPSKHPCITRKEKEYLEKEIGETGKKIPKPPWRKILSSPPVLALLIAHFTHDWVFFTMTLYLPKYMSGVLNYSFKESAYYSSLPWLTMWAVAILSGLLGDWLVRKNYLSVTAVRKVFTTIGHAVPGIGLIAASYTGCNREVVIPIIIISLGIMGMFYPGMRVNAIDLSPNYAGTIMAFTNGIGVLSGIISPYVVGVLTPNETIEEWRSFFWMTGAFSFATVAVFAIWGTAKVQSWNESERDF